MSDTYKIKLPTGQILEGIPVGIDPEDVLATYKADTEKNSQANRGYLNTMRTAAGRSFVNAGRNLAMLAGSEGARESAVEAETLDEDLKNSPGYLPGSVAGEAAMFAAPSAILSKVPVLAAALKANPVKGAALVGAGAGYGTSTPSTRTGSTIAGGVGGAAGGTLSRALSAAARGPVATNPAARQYMEETGESFLPLAKRAKEGSLMQKLYRDILPSLPFSGRQLVKQEDEAFKGMRGHMVGKVVPEGHTVQIDPGDMHGTLKELDDVYTRAFGSVDDYVIDPLTNQVPALNSLLRGDHVPMSKTVLRAIQQGLRPNESGWIPVKSIMQARTDILAEAGKAARPIAAQLRKLANDITEETLDHLPKAAQKEYQAALEKFPAYKVLAKTVQGSGEGFSPQQLASRGAKAVSERKGAAGEGPLQREATMAADALGKELGDPGFWRNMATLGMTSGVIGGGLAGGPAGAIIAGVTLLGVPKALATKTVQKALLGDFAAQKAIAKLVSENPQAYQAIMIEIQAMSGAAAGRE